MTYDVEEIKERIGVYDFKELSVLMWLVKDERRYYTADEFLYIDSLIMQRANHLRYVLSNPWWFWLS